MVSIRSLANPRLTPILIRAGLGFGAASVANAVSQSMAGVDTATGKAKPAPQINPFVAAAGAGLLSNRAIMRGILGVSAAQAYNAATPGPDIDWALAAAAGIAAPTMGRLVASKANPERVVWEESKGFARDTLNRVGQSVYPREEGFDYIARVRESWRSMDNFNWGKTAPSSSPPEMNSPRKTGSPSAVEREMTLPSPPIDIEDIPVSYQELRSRPVARVSQPDSAEQIVVVAPPAVVKQQPHSESVAPVPSPTIIEQRPSLSDVPSLNVDDPWRGRVVRAPQPEIETFKPLAMIKPAFNYDVPTETPVQAAREKAVEIAEERKNRPRVVTLKPTAVQRKQYEWDQEWG